MFFMNEEQEPISITLSRREFQTILESLLYTAVPEVCINQYKEDIENIMKLAINLRKNYPSIPTSNTYINNFMKSELIADKQLEFFPELQIN